MANQQLARTDQIREAFRPIKKTIDTLLTDPAKASRFMAAAFHVAQDTNLDRCSVESIAQAVVGVAMLDLEIDKNIAHAYLINYKGKAQLQIGYRGWIQLLWRAGWVIKAFPIYKSDTFELKNDGWDTKVNYIPNIDEQDEGDPDWVFDNLRGVYVVARNKQTGDEFARFASKKLIEKLRLLSSSQKIGEYTKPDDKVRLNNDLPVGIWQQFYAEMSIAKAIKKLAKILPIGDSPATLAVAVDDKSDMGRVIDYQRTVEQGTIVEQDEAVLEKSPKADQPDEQPTELINTDVLTQKIETSTNLQELESLLDDLKKIPKDQVKPVRAAYGKKLKQFKEIQAKPPTDWVAEIEAVTSVAELEALYESMPELLRIEHQQLGSDKYAQLTQAV